LFFYVAFPVLVISLIILQEIRDICDTFAAQGLPNYPHGIIFTFWEQYINLRFYLLLALIAVLAAIFVILSILLLNPWAALVVVSCDFSCSFRYSVERLPPELVSRIE
jgi:hypothetical protein